MKYPPARRLARPPRLMEFPPTPLMLELRAAGEHGNELLARYLEKSAQAQARSKKISRLLVASVVVAAFLYRWLHPEWPLSLLPNWIH